MVQSLFINPNFLMPTYDLNVNNIIEVVGLKKSIKDRRLQKQCLKNV